MSVLQWGRDRLERRRGDASLIGTVLRAIDLDRRRAGGLMAGGIAFRAFLWLLPSALLGVGILGLVRDISHDRPEVVARKVGLSGVVGHSVGEAVQQSSRGTLVLIVLGTGLTIYLGMALVRAMRVACAIAWSLPLERRPNLPRDAVLVSLALGIQLVNSALAPLLRDSAGRAWILVTVGTALVAGLVWLGIAMLLPHGDAPSIALLPGAALMAIALPLLSLVTSYYLAQHVETAGDVYGSLGVAAMLLLWLYVVARLFVISAFFDAALWERRRARTADG